MSTYYRLLEAVKSEDLSFLQDLLSENADEINLNDGDVDGVTGLHIAAGLESNNILEYLLDHGADVDSQTQEGLTPLHIAAMWGKGGQVATLLNHGADCSLVDSNGCNALMHAINSEEEGSEACVQLILSNQENRNRQDGRLKRNKKSQSELDDFEKLNHSPWITPRRGSRESKRSQVENEKTKCPAKGRFSIKFASCINAGPFSSARECTEESGGGGNPEENFEELLTELSSGLLSSSGRSSFTDSDSTTFSYSTITCLDPQRLASLSNVDCSEYRTVYSSGILTECSTSDEIDEKGQQGERDGMKIDEFGNVGGHAQKSGLAGRQSRSEMTNEDTCVYETADEELEEDLKKRKQDGNHDKNFEEEWRKDENAPETMKEEGNVEAKNENGLGKKNKGQLKPKCKQNEEHDVEKSEEQKPNSDKIEKKKQNEYLLNINKDFNNLSMIDQDDSEKPVVGEDKHLNDSADPKINQSNLPVNSTFLVDSPLQRLSKQQANFFIPIQNDKPSLPESQTKPSVAVTPKRNNGEETIIYDWKELSMDKRNETMAIIPAYYKKISCSELRKKMKDHGQLPGPITAQTKMLYVKKLWKLDQGIGTRDTKDSSPVSLYPVEIRLILTGKTEIPDCSLLEQEMINEFCKSPRKVQWRGGTEKSSFNYLLIDPRVTLNLPQRSKKISFTEAFRCFVLSIFYVGKGKRSRPYAHLHEAIKYSNSKSNKKLDQIWEIWRDGLGVISLHLFQSAIPVEAFTREACMVEALGLSQLTNQKRGEYYGLCAKLELAKKRRLGIFLLYKAFQIFLQEGEREICKDDL